MDLNKLKIYEEDFSVVVLGSFNPSIQQPEWYIRHGIVPSDKNYKVRVISEEVSQFSLGELQVTCTVNNFDVKANGLGHQEAVLDLVNSVISILKDTPIRACGVNIKRRYSVADEKHWHKIGHTLAPKKGLWDELDVGKMPGMKRLDIRYLPKIEEYPGEVNVVVAPVDIKKIQIQTNHHCELKIGLGSDEQFESIERLEDFLDYAKGESINCINGTQKMLDEL